MSKTSYKRLLPADRKGERQHYKKLTDKQLAIYYWFVSKSYWNFSQQEKHYYIYYSDINYSQIARDLGIGSTNTVKNGIKTLVEKDFLWKNEDLQCYWIPHQTYSTYLNINLIKFLLAWSIPLGAEVILFYSILKRCFELTENKKFRFCIKSMVMGMGRNKNDATFYKKLKLYLAFFKEYDLIEVSEEVKTKNGAKYIQYMITGICEDISEKCNYLDDEDVPQIDQEILEKVSADLKTQLTAHSSLD